MPNTEAYAQVVKETFRSRALRTALIIDDQFPTYADMFDAASADKYSEKDRAVALYQLFRANDMPCDIENKIGDVAGDVERIRKCDLIILDYHLDPGSNDPSKSIDLVRKLAETKHFNTVVVYTREPRLEDVWLNLACALRQGWCPPEDVLADDPTALEEWYRLSDEGQDLPRPTGELIRHHILRGPKHWPKPDRTAIRSELEALGVPSAQCKAITAALIHREVRDELKVLDEARAMGTFPVTGSFEAGKPLWLQVRNCFVVILGKRDDDESAHPTDANRILDCLDAALNDWHPNLIQVLVSEIQNIFELDALATDEDEFRDPATQTGLTYYLLDSLEEGCDPNDPEQLRGPLQALVDKIVETLRHKLVSDAGLLEVATGLLAEELKNVNWPTPAASKRNVYKAATQIARTRAVPEPEKIEALFALNMFLSTEPFRRHHITTGTVFRDPQANEYWVCASPACDMVARLPSAFQKWAYTMHPLRSVMAVQLHPVTLQDALSGAHHSRYAFFKDQEPLAFSVVHGNALQPVYEMFFVDDAGKWKVTEGGAKVFSAARLKGGDAEARNPKHLLTEQLMIVGQLRPSYAARILHVVGYHLSRIGLDFVDMP